MDRIKGRSDFSELQGDRYEGEEQKLKDARDKKNAKRRERNKTPEAKLARSIYLKEYNKRPEVKRRAKEYLSRPGVEGRRKELRASPKYMKKHRETCRAAEQRTRREVIELYGGKCVCCGETNIEFLAIDHINGGGREERAKHRSWFYYLKKNKPTHVRILCHNCNMSMGFYGYCPHDKHKG
jgi:hypothetical protein